MKLSVALCLVALIASTLVDADMYLHSPRGGNNRLDEANRDRNNGNRLWDSQNNNRGGNNHGTFGREYFYEGSQLRVEWTNQHTCGNPNNVCDIIFQYYCDNNITRDGMTTNTIPDVTQEQTQCVNSDCDLDPFWGRHESFDSYQSCKYRQRNKGLWTSTQDMSNRDGAIFTRQNNNGNRHGYECPEERDYYPYWHPSVWKDIAILTNDTSRCQAWQAESQNVKERYYCDVPQSYMDKMIGTDPTQMNNRFGFIPIQQAPCVAIGGTWTKVDSWGIPAPQCEQSPWTRDNHLGNTFGGETASWNWTIPSHTIGESCVFRVRYNISTRETRDGGDWASATSVQAGPLNKTRNWIYIAPPNGITIDDNDDTVETTNPKYFKYCDQLDVWTKYGMTKSENAASFDPVLFYNNGLTRGYVFRNDPVVDIFGSLIPQTTMWLRLAFDTSQFGRTFQDRSHTFAIRMRPTGLATSPGTIYNLGVRGKRGNIVQVFPSVEYDFVPNTLKLNQGDWIHFQWQGSNTNPANNAGQGTAGTDRSNIVTLPKYGIQYAPQATAQLRGPGIGPDGVTFQNNWKLSYPSRVDDDFLGLDVTSKKWLAVQGVYSPYFDMKPVVMANAGVYNYICTRNNAFTNRGQKAQIQVMPVANADQLLAAAAQVDTSRAQLISSDGTSWIRYAPDPNGLTTNSQLRIDELGDGRILITPFLFDVIPGQMVMLDMVYTQRPLTDVYIYQSDYDNYNGNQMNTNAGGGVATVQITRGGYYHLEQQVAASAVAGVVIGVAIGVGLIGFGYYKLNQKFHFRDRKYMATATNA